MELYLVLVFITSSFLLGRLTNFQNIKKIEKIKSELNEITASRDRWRQQCLDKTMKDKLSELNCKSNEVS